MADEVSYYSDWMTPKTVAWTEEEYALVSGMPYPVAKGFIGRSRKDHAPSYADLFGGQGLGNIFGNG